MKSDYITKIIDIITIYDDEYLPACREKWYLTVG